MSRLIGSAHDMTAGHAAARVGAHAPASGVGGRMTGPLRAPGGVNPARRDMLQTKTERPPILPGAASLFMIDMAWGATGP